MFSKLNIQSRLMIPIIIMVVLVVSLIVLVQRTENKIADMNRAVDTAQLVSYEFAEIRSLSRSLQRDALNLIIEPDAGEIMVIRGKFDGRIAKMTEQLGHLRTRLPPAERTGLKGYFTSQWTVLKQLEAVSRLASSGHQTEALAAFRTGVRVAERQASKVADAQITAWLAKIDTLRSEAQSTGNQSRRNLVISSVVLSAIAVVVGFFMTIWTVVSPLRGIQNAMARLAIGATEHSTPYLEHRDEIGDMARAVEVFRTAMHERDLLRSEAEAAAATEFERRQEASEAERQREEAHRREDERRREVAHAATLALAERFETTVGEVVGVLSSAATQLQSTAEVMSTTADLTMRQAANVAVASEQAAASVQTAATAGEELTSSIGEIHRQVSTSADVARATAEEARATDHTVAELAEAAEQVGRVIGMISSIAAQTNLLALNATIEAARAGEAGRGFAVVAAEVKELAAQTSKATQEVSNQIGSIQSSTGASVTALRSIGQQIARLDGISTAIASAVEQQAAASHEVARSIEAAASGTEQVFSNISEVSDAARETGAAATQVLASATELSKQAVTLRTQVGEFLTHVRAA